VLQNVAVGGAGYTGKVHAPVILEVLVFDGRDCVVENLGDLLPGHQDTALQGEAADELAVVGIDFRDYVGTIGFEGANFGQVAFVNKQHPAAAPSATEHRRRNATATRSMSFQPRRRRVIGGAKTWTGNSNAE